MFENTLAEKNYKTLYKLGGVFSFLTVLMIIFSIISFFFYPIFPDNILKMVQDNTFAGLLSLDFLYLLAVLFTLPIIITLYTSLKISNEPMTFFALVSGIIGVILIIHARPIIEIFTLSKKLATSTNDIEKIVFIINGNILIDQFKGTSYYLHLLFGDISFLLFSFLMLKSHIYSRSIALLGIITNIIAFGMFIPTIGPYIGLVFLLGFIPWLFRIGIVLSK